MIQELAEKVGVKEPSKKDSGVDEAGAEKPIENKLGLSCAKLRLS